MWDYLSRLFSNSTGKGGEGKRRVEEVDIMRFVYMILLMKLKFVEKGKKKKGFIPMI